MAVIQKIRIQHYRSIQDVTISFPSGKPLILIGENNVGKSNIISAIDLLLGESYPTYKTLEISDYYHRITTHEIEIEAEFVDGSLYADRFKKVVFKHLRNRAEGEDSKLLDSITGRLTYLKQEQRHSCMLVCIPADRNISWQLSYSNKYTMLSRLMHRFHDELVQRADVIEDLKGHSAQLNRR